MLLDSSVKTGGIVLITVVTRVGRSAIHKIVTARLDWADRFGDVGDGRTVTVAVLVTTGRV